MELFFRKLGKGPPLLILHGLYGASDNWITIGKTLSKHFEVFMIDQRNHGRSPHSNIHNYEVMKNDLKKFMDQRNIIKATFLGHSMGGKTIIFFAAEFPERVSNLIVVDISPKAYKTDSESAFQIEEHNAILNSMLNIDLSKINSREEVNTKMAERIQSDRIRQFLLKNLKRSPNNTFHWSLNLKILKNELHSIMDGLDEKYFEGDNKITGFPVLFIKGEKSNYISETDISIIKKIFPLAEIVNIPDAGHWLHAEQTELFTRTVIDFILE